MNFIIFRAPGSIDELENDVIVDRTQKFTLGSYNRKLVQYVLEYNGFSLTNRDEYAISWRSSPESDGVIPISFFQKLNHFPYSKQIIGDKGVFANILQNHPHFHEFQKFLPNTFVLPQDRDGLFQVMKSRPQEKFIVKPPKGSCGHGIQLLSYSDFFKIPPGSVVSDYISKPLTIDSFKFDLRIYVLVTSFFPLSAFIYKNGLARFATERYNTHGDSPYSHLTNATLNKKRMNWSSDFKWKLSELLNELQHRYGRSYESLYEQIIQVVMVALALLQPSMKKESQPQAYSNYFELFGFDILFDKNFHAWLLEINTFPSLGYEEDVDFNVKAPLVAQTLSIVGVPDYPFDELAKNSQLQKEILMTSSRQFELEDERNKLSGSGFIRLFPSKVSDHLQPLLVKQSAPPIENLPTDESLNIRQYSELVVYYLKHLFIKLCTKHLPQKDVDKVSVFFSCARLQVSKNNGKFD